MKNRFTFIKQYINYIYRFLLTATTIGLIMLLFPNTGNFKYEYQKGKPWMHETLIAPFDFSVMKTEKELQQDRDSILNRFSPYFKVDTSIYSKAIVEFEKNFEKKWKLFEEPYLFVNTSYSEKIAEAEKARCHHDLKALIKKYYNVGIADFQSEQLQYDFKLPETINKSVDNISEQVFSNRIYSPKTAYEDLISSLKANYLDPVFFDFLQNLNLDSYLMPNLFYDKESSEKVKSSLLSNISFTKGKIDRGTRIVLKGDVIDDEKFLILESLKKEHESILGSSQSHYLIVGGQSLLVIACIVLLFLYLRNFRKEILFNNKKLLFIFLLVLLFVSLSSLVLQFPSINIYILPFALITIVVRTLMDSRTALFVFIITVLITGFLAPNSFEFVFLQLAAGITAIYSLPRLERRGQLVLTAAITFITYSVIYFAFAATQEGSIEKIEWFNFVWFAINGLLLTFSYTLIYIFEKLFGFLSDVTLIELSNQNHPLLRKLIQNSPGTFQHSLQVANLAEAAINKIGGNPLLVRTGALYHDIGKMRDPVYFIENQTSEGSPHDHLGFDESAKIITDHVKYGVKIAKKHKLPQQIIDFIETHHGAGKVMYFYTSFKNKYPEKEINEDKFRYPGPDPFTKETAVLMMADGIEAASRSLKEKTPESIRELINNIIQKQIDEKRFENADITFKNIHEVKEVFANNLINAYHARIEYPKENQENKES